jgi:hypothetical protein
MAKFTKSIPNPVSPAVENQEAPGTTGIPASVASASSTGRGKGGRPSSADKEAKAELAAKESLIKAKLQEMYTAEQWGKIAALPFDARAVILNFPAYALSPEEKLMVGGPLSLLAMKYLDKSPEWVAVAVLVISLTQIYIGKEMAWNTEKKLRPSPKNQSPTQQNTEK